MDRRFGENWAGAGRAGLERGAYHFFTFCSPGEPQARNFLRTVPADRDSLQPAVDLELKGNCRARPAAGTVRRELNTFLEIVESETGKTAVLYLGDDFEDRYRVGASLHRPLWKRRFLRRPSVEGWVIWQLHGYARVDGIDGGVDLDVRRPAGKRGAESGRR